MKKNEQIYSKNLNAIENTTKPNYSLISDINADIEDLKENERTLQQKLSAIEDYLRSTRRLKQ